MLFFSFYHLLRIRVLLCCNSWILSYNFFGSFGGAGATIAYKATIETDEVTVESSVNRFSSVMGTMANKALPGSNNLAIDIKAGLTMSVETSTSTKKGVSYAASLSFELGDSDEGDYFDVQVCIGNLHFLNSCSPLLSLSRYFKTRCILASSSLQKAGRAGW